jgi:copper resistance protein C
MRRMVLAAALTLAGASAALAHAQLQKASPPVGGAVEAPQEIRLTFSESLEAKLSKLTLKNAAGAVQPTASPALAPGDPHTLVVGVTGKLGAGVYTVEWRAVSTDSHRTTGSFGFTVK